MQEQVTPYEVNMKKLDQHEADIQRTIRDRGRTAIAVFLLFIVSFGVNIYQVTLPKMIPYVYAVDDHGKVVSRLLLKAEEIPNNGAAKEAVARRVIKDWIENARLRSSDRDLTARGLTSAARITSGIALVKLRADTNVEELWKNLERETVEVHMPKDPIFLAGKTWQAEWTQIVKGTRNMELRREEWSGTFTLDTQEDWITGYDPFGFRVVDYTVKPFAISK